VSRPARQAHGVRSVGIDEPDLIAAALPLGLECDPPAVRRTAPKEKMSLRASAVPPDACSGDM